MTRAFACVLLIWAAALWSEPVSDAEALSSGQCVSIKELVNQGVRLRRALARDILDDKNHLEALRRRAASWVSNIYCLEQNVPGWHDLQASRLDYCLLQMTFQRALRTVLTRIETLKAEIEYKKQLYLRLRQELEVSRAAME